MANPQEHLASWQKATLDATLGYAQASIAGAEQLLKLTLDAARGSLEQAGKNTRDLLAINDPQELVQLRSKILQSTLQQTASYTQNIYEVLSQTQALLTKLNEEQLARLNKEAAAGAEQLSQGAPGAEVTSAAVKSTLAATSALMDNLNQASKQFAELSEASIKAATAGMFNNNAKK